MAMTVRMIMILP